MRKVTTMQSGGVLFLQVAARREHARAEQILFITRSAASLFRNYLLLSIISCCSHRNDEMLRERAERKARPRSLVHQAAMEEDNHEGEEHVEVREE